MTPKYASDQPAGFVRHVQNIAVVGAAGQSGTCITAELLKTGQHIVTAITRSESQSTFPRDVKVARVSYDDRASLVGALSGQDVLIITMKVTAPADSVKILVEAAIEAKVPWILPNEWGFDYTDRDMNRDTMLGDGQLAVRKMIETKGDGAAWIAVACGFWYDYSLAAGKTTLGFDFSKKEAIFYDDGNFSMSYSTLPYLGHAVARLLSLPILPNDSSDKGPCLEDYRDRIIRFRAMHLNQKGMLESVLRVTGDSASDWTIKHESSKDRYTEGTEALKSGDRMGYRQMLYSRAFYPSNPIHQPEDYSDEHLGLQKPELDDVTRWVVSDVAKQQAL